jgi:hypothetical protein
MTCTHTSSGPPKLLAAYRLGLLSHTFTVWRDLFSAMPESEHGTAESVSLAIEQMADAVVVLATDIHANVYSELRKLLDDQKQRWEAVCAMVFKYHEDAGDWDNALIGRAVEQPTPSLQPLADAAVVSPALRPWFDLGVAVGEYQVELPTLAAGQALPTLGKIVDQATAANALQPLSVLQAMVDLAPELDKLSPREFLSKAVLGAEDARSDVFGAPSFDAYVVLNLLLKLDTVIQEALEGRGTPLSAAPVAPVTEAGGAGAEVAPGSPEAPAAPLVPKWDKEHGDLLLGDTVARKVAKQARNLIPVLDAFEAQGWPKRIDDPIALPINPARAEEPQRMVNAQRLNDTVKTLNKDLNGMRFHADGTGTRITWQLA